MLISGAVRNAETFEHFRQACGMFPRYVLSASLNSCTDCKLAVRSKFSVEEVHFEAKPMREQTSLFYATAVPLKILSITKAKPDM